MDKVQKRHATVLKLLRDSCPNELEKSSKITHATVLKLLRDVCSNELDSIMPKDIEFDINSTLSNTIFR
ncbi:hypothetical protein H5410_005832 [Solanum commersonii]|uniref:Uncharacterized protein n=1 Tax=Solanum commersonii TaxID=4109 RepID=A0A9J6A7I0_SOLCO|nr:hypothetical protein H5410_005832 [Solanum commersonii]